MTEEIKLRELRHLVRRIDEEISDCRRDIKETETTGDVEVRRSAEEHMSALRDQRQQAADSLELLGK
jgi:hypothetical protein